MNNQRPNNPSRRSYESPAEPMAFESLPFVYRPDIETNEDKRCNWNVQPTNDYGDACKVGRDYAAYLAQYLNENPYWVGSNVLNRIVSDMDFSDKSAAKGYWVGFFAHLERLIYGQAKAIDVYADVAMVNAHYAKLDADRKLEAEET